MNTQMFYPEPWDDHPTYEECYFPGYADNDRDRMKGYNPDIMWGGTDKAAIAAMMLGDDPGYVFTKAYKCGGMPGDEGVLVHPSFDYWPDRTNWNAMFKVFVIGGMFSALLFGLCWLSLAILQFIT